MERKPKRPRISEARPSEDTGETARYEKVDYLSEQSQATEGEAENNQPRGYQPRYNRDGYQPRGYQPRGYQSRGYNPRYQQGGYNPRYQQGYNQPRQERQPDVDADGAQVAGENIDQTQQQQGYRPRGYQPRGYQSRGYGQQGDSRQGGYQPRGYNPRYQQGGYQPRGGYDRSQGGYDREQDGYQPRTGYDRGQGGYQPRGGYGQQGGYRKPGRPGYGGPKAPHQQMRFTPRPKQIEYEEPVADPNTQMRLNKFLANAGICSRREADELIVKGVVTVNGNIVTELGYKISPQDVVEYDGKVVSRERKCYVLLNKPKDCVTTSEDPRGRKTVMDLVKGACEERIYPVGRLDRNTTGVLLLTNDGDLASKLTHPKYVKKKIYQVWTDKPISEEDMQHIADGVELDDGPIHADAVSYVNATDRKQAGIEIHSGRNRVVRRIFEHLGYHVVKLDRVYFAGLTKKNLARGRWRYLTQEEVNFLRQGSFE